jgi:hypothetical protein
MDWELLVINSTIESLPNSSRPQLGRLFSRTSATFLGTPVFYFEKFDLKILFTQKHQSWTKINIVLII